MRRFPYARRRQYVAWPGLEEIVFCEPVDSAGGVFGLGKEGRGVPLNQAVQPGLLRSMAVVGGWGLKRNSALAGAAGQCLSSVRAAGAARPSANHGRGGSADGARPGIATHGLRFVCPGL